MYKVISQLFINKYAVLEINNEIPQKKYSHYLIDGKTYDCVPIYDFPKHIAIISDKSFVGKTVEFI